ncbi:prepilin-type N-terminal cleavage/methylation domain-containing protein [Leptolyngbya sp. FACHB-261]|uniref:prepilin-type N-terminal cleavage/methylation domain-containing protein n=1 Tax=Leptolyngbya sp. FACHB-261 TaxID=2692806 RepID=UPI001686835D|nr:prepilin-type N-terminal cleavage/methylation domain-containing protein [Leptolyngbya sp. FACHB-261]MBD2100832.1 prepilin-type N-terminal cleavage/methylation domain-containing protein [Leptolyngbya sp. FACHB-261]
MSTQLFKPLFRMFRTSPERSKKAGFTLVELLVSAVIASIVVSSLLYIVNELLQTNQRDFAKTQTQQDMKMALDYIGSDVKEAIYLYPPNCLTTTGVNTSNSASLDFCPGLLNHIALPPGSVPVIAFWKPEPLPSQCQSSGVTICNNYKIVGRSYSLILYALMPNQTNSIWKGKARILRYTLNAFATSNNTLVSAAGYVAPLQQESTFRKWPYEKTTNNTWTNQQNGTLPGSGNTPTLVDFIDNEQNSSKRPAPSCPVGYELTPTNAATVTRSFYGCIRAQSDLSKNFNQDVLVFLRGNANGRPGVVGDNIIPTMQTQILSRAILDKTPSPDP